MAGSNTMIQGKIELGRVIIVSESTQKELIYEAIREIGGGQPWGGGSGHEDHRGVRNRRIVYRISKKREAILVNQIGVK